MQKDGEIVSRNEIFDNDGSNEMDSEPYSYGNIEFEEVDVADNVSQRDTQSSNDGVIEFQLFANSGPVQIDLQAKAKEFEQHRPDTYYFYSVTSQEKANIQRAAVSGEAVLREAKFWAEVISQRKFEAPDINADWKPRKRRCRPGKSARASRRQLKEKAELRQKEYNLNWQLQREQHFYKHREPLKIPKQSPNSQSQSELSSKHSNHKPEQYSNNSREPQPLAQLRKSPKLGHRAGVKLGPRRGKTDHTFSFK